MTKRANRTTNDSNRYQNFIEPLSAALAAVPIPFLAIGTFILGANVFQAPCPTEVILCFPPEALYCASAVALISPYVLLKLARVRRPLLNAVISTIIGAMGLAIPHYLPLPWHATSEIQMVVLVLWLMIVFASTTQVTGNLSGWLSFGKRLVTPLPGTRAWVTLGRPNASRLVRFTIITAAAACVILAAWFGVRTLSGYADDNQLVKKFASTSAEIYATLPKTPAETHAVYAWRSASQQLASNNGLEYAASSTDFTLCANFSSDASSSAAPKSKYTAEDVAKHHSGYQCFDYPLAGAR